MDFIVFCTVFVVLFFLISVLMAVLWQLDRNAWQVERNSWFKKEQDLLNRLMAKDWGSYLAITQATAEVEKEPEVIEKTTDYDKAWTM